MLEMSVFPQINSTGSEKATVTVLHLPPPHFILQVCYTLNAMSHKWCTERRRPKI